MINIKPIYKKEVLDLLNNSEFWNYKFLSISKHRLFSHYNNPNLDENDIVLLLAYVDTKLVGYMGVYIDVIVIGNKTTKIGWLSTWWVDPSTKGSGVGREILNQMYAYNNGNIGISQFTKSAKRVYDKSGLFVTLQNNVGIKVVLRSTLSSIIPKLLNFNKINLVLRFIDFVINIIINCKLNFLKFITKNNLKDTRVEYLNYLDKETIDFVENHNKNDLFKKNNLFYTWLKNYKWVEAAPVIDLTNNNKYEFSIYDKTFEIYLIKITKNNTCVGFVVLQKRNFVCKVLFSYFDEKDSKIISDVIKLQCINQNVKELISYDSSLNVNFSKSFFILYKTKKLKQSIISKKIDLNHLDKKKVKLHFGDGDCCFT